MSRRVGTDARYALQTKKGTGYYKIPSLKGVWYRGPFEHNGSVATLEDWFDSARLRENYRPTGFNQDFHFDPGTATVYTHAARIPRLSALNPAHQLRRQAPKPVRPLTDVDGTG